MEENPLTADFFARSTVDVAKDLVGKLIWRQLAGEYAICRIVETEAYLARNDPACHASKKRTARNEVMFGEPGLIYVYSIHARFCLNFVTGRPGHGSAVLIRAAEPLEGIELMHQNRCVSDRLNLLSGPAKLCEALLIDKSFNGQILNRSSGLWATDDGYPVDAAQIRRTRRIGVTSAKKRLLRFVLRGSKYASGPRNLR